MIKDHLNHRGQYLALHPLFGKAFQYLKSWNPETPDGRYELEGDHLVAMPQSYTTSPIAEKKIEAHKRYIDIQYMVSGHEGMLIMPAHTLTVSESYDEKRDVLFYKDPAPSPALMDFQAGEFGIFYPWDAHKPGCIPVGSSAMDIRKIVVKVRI